MKTASMAFIVTILFWIVPAMAQSEDLRRQSPCKADIEKFCKDAKPGQGRIVRCMKEHEGELSQACKDQIAADREKLQEFRQACQSDTAKFCKDIKPGHGRIISCLKSHEAELSPQCNAYFRKN